MAGLKPYERLCRGSKSIINLNEDSYVIVKNNKRNSYYMYYTYRNILQRKLQQDLDKSNTRTGSYNKITVEDAENFIKWQAEKGMIEIVKRK